MTTQFIFFLTVISFPVFAQENNNLVTRKAFNLKISVDTTFEYKYQVPQSDYILPDKTIQIYPGENINVEIEEENGFIRSMKTVKENKNPNKTITISFGQIADKKIHQTMMLKIYNPFNKDLLYSVKNFLMMQKKWIESEVLPVNAGLSAIETWPDIIVTIALFDLKFSKK